MAYVDGFEHDIFISYAHVDDETASKIEGWVTKFYNELRVALRKHVHKDIDLWRDERRRLDGGQVFDKTIQDALTSSAVFVALTSRGYLDSEYCRDELASFHREATADKDHGLIVGDRRRIVNVLLTNIDYSNWPEEFGTEEGDRTSGFSFHDAKDDTPKETSFPSKSEDPKSGFEIQLNALTIALKVLLKAMKDRAMKDQAMKDRTSLPDAPKPSDSAPSIFIAEVADTLRKLKKRIIADLKMKRPGINIISDPEADQMIEVLRKVDLSVHLLDDLSSRKIIQQQVDLALKHAKMQMIWVPEDLNVEVIDEEGLQVFLQQLERGPREKNYDFIRAAPTSSSIVQHILEILDTPKPNPEPGRCLLVIHEKDTLHKHFPQVADVIREQGILPIINQFAEEPGLELDLFKQRLRRAENLIVFFGDVEIEWVNERLKMIVKAIVNEDAGDLNFAVYGAPPPPKRPEDVTTGFVAFKPEFLDNTKAFNPSTILTFLNLA